MDYEGDFLWPDADLAWDDPLGDEEFIGAGYLGDFVEDGCE